MPRVFTLKLRALGDEADIYRRIRRALKTLLRRDRLRCLSIEEDKTAAGTDSRLIPLEDQNMTTNGLEKTSLTVGDGFDGYNIDVAGKENKPSGIFRGERLKFGKTGEWENPAGEVIDEGAKLIFLDITRLDRTFYCL